MRTSRPTQSEADWVHPRWSRSVIARFVARRSLRSAAFTALALGAFTASKAIGYVDVYPTTPQRLAAGALMEANPGYSAIFGPGHALGTALGYAAWFGIGMSVLMTSIWAYILATRQFRGEETAGRWEHLLVGQTSFRRATAQALAGVGAAILAYFLIVTTAFIIIGRQHDLAYSSADAIFFALAVTAPALMFAAVGAVSSQLMPTRARAVALATAVFGLCLVLRAGGSITSAKWLLNITPLGWVDQLRPLTDPRPGWLWPIAVLTAGLAALTIYLAGRRDLGASLIRDRDVVPPHTRLLGSPLGLAVRLTRGSSLGWLLGFGLLATYFGALTDTATQAFKTSNAQQLISAFAKTSATNAGAQAFLGIVFMLLMLALMAYAASALGTIRAEEAEGYADHLLVRPIGRQRWLWSRLSLVTLNLLALAGLGGLALCLGLGSHTYGLQSADFVNATANTLPPALFIMGLGVLTYGYLPRFTTVVAYGVIAWSFIIQMLASGTQLSHWLLDTSLLYHVAFAPATSPNWSNNLIIMALGALMLVVGALGFNRRDVASE